MPVSTGRGPEPGSRWRQVKLGSEAVYEVVAEEDGLVEVIVCEAPGLAPGTRVRFTQTALAAMERLPAADGSA
jgi:hypothetical protein